MGTEKRLVQWDLLRALAMFLVIVNHASPYLGIMQGIDAGKIVGELALICNPVFFALSGYFAIRKLTTSYASYLWKKFLTVLLPLIVYGFVMYLYAVYRGEISVSPGNVMRYYQYELSGNWWFIPALIPCLLLAPWLHTMFEALDINKKRALFMLVSAAMTWGIIVSCLAWCAKVFQLSGLEALARALALFVPPRLVPGEYFVFFCLGYFIRLLPQLVSKVTLRRCCVSGLVLWVVGAVLVAFGYERANPSYLWFFATIGVFYLFQRINVTAPAVCACISFVARRSYSVYLFNYASLCAVLACAQSLGLFTSELSLVPPPSFSAGAPMWVAFVVVGYAVSFFFACVCDLTILKLVQRFVQRVLHICRPKLAADQS